MLRRHLNIIVLTVCSLMCFVCVGMPAAADASGSPSTYASAVLADHPTAYYQFNDPTGSHVFADSSGNKNPAVSEGPVQLVTPGPLGPQTQALLVGNGDEGAYALGLRPLEGDNERTLELWFKTTQTADQCVLSAGEQSHTHAFSLCLTNGQQGGAPPPNTPGVYLQTFDADIYIPNLTLTDNQWHYIAVTLSGSTVTIDVDGQTPSGFVWNGSSYSPLATQPFTLPFQPNTTNQRVPGAIAIGSGNGIPGWAAEFSGEIGEVAIYPTALTSAQLAAHYEAATGSSPPGGGGGNSSGGTTPIPVPSTGGSCTDTPKCPPSRPQGVACGGCSKFDGAYNQFLYTQVGGIYARVRNYSPWVDPASYSVSAWVGLQYCAPPGPNGCNENELAQIGWREQPYGQRDTLIEYLLPGGDFSDCNPKAVGARGITNTNHLTCNSIPIPAAPALYSYYTVLYGYEPGKFTFYVNGRKVASAPANFVPHQAEVYGETNLVGDQMPGDANDPEIFEDINVYVNGAWQPFTPTHVSRNTIYNGANYGGYLALSAPPGRGSCLGIWDTMYGDASAAVRSICSAAAQVSNQAAAISVQATQHVRSSVVVPLSCPIGNMACSGTISLEQSLGGGSLARVGARSHRVAKPIAFSLPPGGRERLRLRLTHVALRKLKSAGRLRVRAVIVANGTGAHASHIASRSFTLLK
jgi:hypothetical protein